MKRVLFILIALFFVFPFNVMAEELIPNAKSGILIEANSGKIIYEKDKDKKLSIASLTKMVGQIIILDEVKKKNIKWSDIVTVSKNASDMGGSQIYLEEGEKISVEDLMKGISVASGNDAMVAMAEYISGSEEKFVKKMNDLRKRLNLKNTHFANCTGLDQDNHYSSSYDVGIIARELVLNYPEILRFSSIYEEYLREGTDRKFWLVNTNKLINFYDGADGLKTGHTDDALYCLSATAKRGDLRLISVVLGENDSKVRNREVMELMDYGFNTTKLKCLMKKGKTIDTINIPKTDTGKINIVLRNNLCLLEDKDSKNKYKYDIKMDKYNIPLVKGDVVGKIYVKNGNDIVGSEDLIVNKSVKKISLIKYIYRNILNLLFGN